MSIIDAITEIPVQNLSPEEQRIKQLNERITELEAALHSALTTANENALKHRRDINTLSNALNNEAIERNWCSEYQDFVRDVNQRLTIELEMPIREYTVYFTATVSGSFTVEAESEEHAQRMADDMSEAMPSYVYLGDHYVDVDEVSIDNIEEDD